MPRLDIITAIQFHGWQIETDFVLLVRVSLLAREPHFLQARIECVKLARDGPSASQLAVQLDFKVLN